MFTSEQETSFKIKLFSSWELWWRVGLNKYDQMWSNATKALYYNQIKRLVIFIVFVKTANTCIQYFRFIFYLIIGILCHSTVFWTKSLDGVDIFSIEMALNKGQTNMKEKMNESMALDQSRRWRKGQISLRMVGPNGVYPKVTQL